MIGENSRLLEGKKKKNPPPPAVLSACSGGDPGGPGDSGAASESAAPVVPVGPPPEAVTLAQMDASKIPVTGAPDWMADDGTELVREDR